MDNQPAMSASKHKVVLFGPCLDAVSGVSTHVRMLFASDLARDYELLHFQVGSEGRQESALQKLMRFTLSPFQLMVFLVRTGAEVVHLNASLDQKAYWRDLVYATVARALSTFVDGVRIAFFAYAFYLSCLLVPKMHNLQMTVINFPMSFIYGFVAAGFAMMTYRAVRLALLHWQRGWSLLERPGESEA